MTSGSLHTSWVRRATTIAVAAGLLLGQTAAVAADNTAAPSAKPAAAPLKPLIPKVAPTVPPVAPPIVKPATPSSTATPGSLPAAQKTQKAQADARSSDQVSELEVLMFGTSRPDIPIEYRLDRLESETFHTTNPDWSTSRRVERLTHTLIGGGAGAPAAPVSPGSAGDPGAPSTAGSLPYPPGAPGGVAPHQPRYPGQDNYGSMPYNQQTDNYPSADYQQAPPTAAAPKRNVTMPPQPDLDSPAYQKELPRVEAEKFALDVVNVVRDYNGLPMLGWDDVAYKVALQHVTDLTTRNTVSHHNAAGENPDVRYTKAGGTDAMLESIVSLKASGRVPLTKAIVYKIVQELTTSQDDRDALLSPYASQFAFSFANSPQADKLIACAEIVTDQADLEPIPTEITVGDKVDIKGKIKGPLKFQRITLAWEGPPPATSDEEAQDEALPYFPPLDYTAYAKKSERDWDKAVRLLQLGGIAVALAGGVFVPPVALAAPLIAASGGSMRPTKAVSDIPVKGGVKVSGSEFEHKAVISKDDKEGIYYITVWVQNENDPTPIAISRRAIIAKPGANTLSSDTMPMPVHEPTPVAQKKDKAKSKGKDKKKKRDLITAKDQKTDADGASLTPADATEDDNANK